MGKNTPPAVSEYFAEIGRRNGKELLRKHGPDYFKRISAMRKTHGRQKKSTASVSKEPPVSEADSQEKTS
jgi:hypothetical protein